MTDSNLDIIRTQEDLINAVSVLYFNLMEIERIYYDMFINPTPMDVEFQRYDDAGVLERILLPNRAKDATPIVTGDGNPNNKQAANPGALYLDVSSLNLYFKSSGTDNQGWILLYSTENLGEYLRPNGDGSRLTNLNANNITSGVLSVERGGTGNGNGVTITGLVKANGTAAYEAATDGIDYLGPNSYTGLICYYPIEPTQEILNGWLICNGAQYDTTDYSNLYARIGNRYNNPEDTDSTKFRVPNLLDYYIKCWDGSTNLPAFLEAGVVGSHRHEIKNVDTTSDGIHGHGYGTLRIRGYIPASEMVYKSGFKRPTIGDSGYGAFKRYAKNVVSGVTKNDVFDQDFWEFDAYKSGGGWSGSTASGGGHTHKVNGYTAFNESNKTNEVKHYQLVPVIKY